MSSDATKLDNDDDLDGYEFFHPVHVLGFWLDELLDRVLKPRFLDPPLNGATLTPEEDEAKYGPIDTTDDWRSWSERRESALKAAEHALDAAVGVNRWLRYGLGERAGKLETGLRQALPDVVSFLKRMTDAESLGKEANTFLSIVGPVHDCDRELCTAAINPDDGALEEWFKIIEAMRSKLAEFLRVHDLLHKAVFRRPRGRIGDLLYRYMVAISDFEILLPAIESQIRRGSDGDEEYERAVEVLRLSARGRWSFEEKLTNNTWGDAPIALSTHDDLRRGAARILQKLEATLLRKPKPGQPRVMWEWGIDHSPAMRPAWDRAQRELRFGDVVCRHLKNRAKNQERVLDAFQEEGWPPRIDDPLLGKARYETVRSLNRGLKLMRFRNDGGGDGICWTLTRRHK